MPQVHVDVGRRWLTGGDSTSLVDRLRDALMLAAVIVTSAVSRRPVRPLGDEPLRPLPGDELVPAELQWTHGVTIRGGPAEIWPWLAQLGCTRAGWYSYDRLDNDGVPSAQRIVPELQHVAVGDILPWTPVDADGFVVRAVDPERALVMGDPDGWLTWALVLDPVDATTTRLLARVRIRPARQDALTSRLAVRLGWRPVHFGMQRRQLLNVKRRVEAGTR